MSTPTGSLRIRQKASLTESLNGMNTISGSLPKGPSLSKRPSLASSARSCSVGSSLAGSQRLRHLQSHAEAIFDQNTPFSTIRLIMKRAASKAPNAPAPETLFRHLMDYFGADEEEVAGVLKNQKDRALQKQQENVSMGYEKDQTVSGSSTPADVSSGVSTPTDGTRFSNAELMLYFNTMLGNLPRDPADDDYGTDEMAQLERCGFNIFEIVDEEKMGFVDDYGSYSTEPSSNGEGIRKAKRDAVAFSSRNKDSVDNLTEETGQKLKIREGEDDDYDMIGA